LAVMLSGFYFDRYHDQRSLSPGEMHQIISQPLSVEKKIPKKSDPLVQKSSLTALAAGTGAPPTQTQLKDVTKAESEKYNPILSVRANTSNAVSFTKVSGISRTNTAGYGKVVVPKDVTVSRMIRQVYGRFSGKLLSQFMASNPGIQSPDHVPAGIRLFFPVSEFAKPVPETGIFSVLMETRQFPQAFLTAMSRKYTKHVPVRILAFPLADGTFLYHVVLDYSFATRHQGMTFMKKNYPDVTPNFLDMVSWTPEQSTTKGSAL